NELVIVRASGLSVWQFLGPIIGVALLIGVFHMTVINPIGAMLVSRYQVMEKQYLEVKDNTVSVSEQGLWLRQRTKDGGVILHAERVSMPEWRLNGVTVFFFSSKGDFLRRTDSQSAVLEPGKWTFNNVIVNEPGRLPARIMRE